MPFCNSIFHFLKVGDPLVNFEITGIDGIYTSDEKAMSRR
jgi:hypothetical protein